MDKKELKAKVIKRLFSGYKQSHEDELSKEEVGRRIELIFDELVMDKIRLSKNEREYLKGNILRDLLGWGPLEELMEDDKITEIMINGPHTIYIERQGRRKRSEIQFDDENHLRYIIERLLRLTGRRIDESHPWADFTLRDGSRCNVIIPPLSVDGSSVTIRKFSSNLTRLESLLNHGTLDEKMAVFLKKCIEAKMSMVFSGATGSGKTTTLKILGSYIRSDERVITIEDALELNLGSGDVVRLLTRPANIEGKGEVSMKDLFRNSLRMRPSRIILGEIRGLEVLDFLQALNSGHRGLLGIIHAASPEEVINRFEMIILYSGMGIPIPLIHRQIVEGLDLVVQQKQLVDGSRKITRVSEIRGLDENNNVVIKDLFRFEEKGRDNEGKVLGKFKPTGVVPQFLDRFKEMGVDISKEIFFSK